MDKCKNTFPNMFISAETKNNAFFVQGHVIIPGDNSKRKPQL